MPGTYYMLFIWIIWIYTTFILDRAHHFRFVIALLALIVLCIYPYTFTIYSIEISYTILIYMFIGYYFASKLSLYNKIYLIVAVNSLMMGYAGFQLLEMYDPIIVFIDKKLMLSLSLAIIAYWIYPFHLLFRIVFVSLGSIQGEMIFALLLWKWDMPYLIGSNEFFDQWALTIVTIICFKFIFALFFRLNLPLKYQKNQPLQIDQMTQRFL